MEGECGGTHVEICISKAKTMDQPFLDHVVGEFRKTMTGEIEGLSRLLALEDCGPENPQARKREGTAG